MPIPNSRIEPGIASIGENDQEDVRGQRDCRVPGPMGNEIILRAEVLPSRGWESAS
jgi:hypothetical protein